MILKPYLNLVLLVFVLQWQLVNHFAIPQHCKWIAVFYFWGFEMFVQVVEWEWIFGVFLCVVMGKVELRLTNGETDVVVEVNGMHNIDIGIEDIE